MLANIYNTRRFCNSLYRAVKASSSRFRTLKLLYRHGVTVFGIVLNLNFALLGVDIQLGKLVLA